MGKYSEQLERILAALGRLEKSSSSRLNPAPQFHHPQGAALSEAFLNFRRVLEQFGISASEMDMVVSRDAATILESNLGGLFMYPMNEPTFVLCLGFRIKMPFVMLTRTPNGPPSPLT